MIITAITGSGISAASGIKTYRAEGSGWDEYAHGIAHYRHYGNHLPVLWQHWTAMGKAIADAKPNAAHIALARAGANIVTQNVDGLHSQAGSENVVELHGDMRTMRCMRCKKTTPCTLKTESPRCPFCDSPRMRTNAVLFGESLLKRNVKTAEQMVIASDLIMVIGTSGEVYPARGFVNDAITAGKRTVLFDIQEWTDNPGFSEVVLGSSETTVSEYLTGEGL